MSAPKLKLWYFDCRGRAECIRYVFAMAEAPYDERLIRVDDEYKSWFQEVKPEMEKAKGIPYSYLPLIEVGAGKSVIQGHTVCARFVAHQLGQAPSDPVLSAQCDMFVDGAAAEFWPFIDKWFDVKYFQGKPDEAQTLVDKFMKEDMPKIVPKYIEAIKATGWLVGEKATWADAYLAEFLDRIKATIDSEALKPFPPLQDYVNRFQALPTIKAFLAKRQHHPY